MDCMELVRRAPVLAPQAVSDRRARLRSHVFVSPEQPITTGGGLTIAHGLGGKPDIVQAHLVCKTAEAGFAANAIIPVSISGGMSVRKDAETLTVRYANNASVFTVGDELTGPPIALTNRNWRLVLCAARISDLAAPVDEPRSGSNSIGGFLRGMQR